MESLSFVNDIDMQLRLIHEGSLNQICIFCYEVAL